MVKAAPFLSRRRLSSARAVFNSSTGCEGWTRGGREGFLGSEQAAVPMVSRTWTADVVSAGDRHPFIFRQ